MNGLKAQSVTVNNTSNASRVSSVVAVKLKYWNFSLYYCWPGWYYFNKKELATLKRNGLCFDTSICISFFFFSYRPKGYSCILLKLCLKNWISSSWDDSCTRSFDTWLEAAMTSYSVIKRWRRSTINVKFKYLGKYSIPWNYIYFLYYLNLTSPPYVP